MKRAGVESSPPGLPQEELVTVIYEARALELDVVWGGNRL